MAVGRTRMAALIRGVLWLTAAPGPGPRAGLGSSTGERVGPQARRYGRSGWREHWFTPFRGSGASAPGPEVTEKISFVDRKTVNALGSHRGPSRARTLPEQRCPVIRRPIALPVTLLTMALLGP